MISIIIFTLIGISASQVCPPPEILHPCTCTNSDTKEINCRDIQESFNLKGVFDNAADFVSGDVIFDQLVIMDTSIPRIEEAAIQYLKFRRIWIDGNSNLSYISPRAFGASRDITTYLMVWNNPIENEVPYEYDIFDFANSFKNLETLRLVHSRISSIPHDAFHNMLLLQDIGLYGNNISSIGREPFYGAPMLKRLSMYKSSIPSEGVHEDAFKGISGWDRVDLDCNQIDYMEQKRFQPLLDRTKVVSVGNDGHLCPESEYARLHCDERADWICDNEEIYRGRLRGFLCKVGTDYADIWEYCEGRNSTLRG